MCAQYIRGASARASFRVMNDLCTWLTDHGSSCLELFGAITGALNVWLVTRERVSAWPLGIVNAVVYTIVFARAGLYSDTGLQVAYALLSVYGWWHWTQHGTQAPLAIGRVTTATSQRLLLIGIAIWVLLASITSRIPGSALPWLDAALVAGSVVAQWMMTRKLLEHWIVWIVLDVVYVGVFISRGLRLTALLYALFLLLAVLGLVQWTRSSRTQRLA